MAIFNMTAFATHSLVEFVEEAGGHLLDEFVLAIHTLELDVGVDGFGAVGLLPVFSLIEFFNTFSFKLFYLFLNFLFFVQIFFCYKLSCFDSFLF